MRGPATTGSGNQDRRQPFGGKRKGSKGKAKKRGGGKGPLHRAMVEAAC